MKNILIIGATSAIAQEFARVALRKGDRLFLVARNSKKLQTITQDFQIRHSTKVGSLVADLNDFSRHETIVATAIKEMGGVDIVLVAHGALGDQRAAEKDFALAEQEFKTNFLSVISLLTPVAAYFEKQRSGIIAVISSVAGDRGRQSNFIYGSAKGGLSIYLAGLRNRLFASGVKVLTIKPGFVDTPMTAHLKKGLLFASAHKVATGIYRAIERGKDVVYLPGFWFWIMLVIRLVPERIFKRLKL